MSGFYLKKVENIHPGLKCVKGAEGFRTYLQQPVTSAMKCGQYGRVYITTIDALWKRGGSNRRKFNLSIRQDKQGHKKGLKLGEFPLSSTRSSFCPVEKKSI